MPTPTIHLIAGCNRAGKTTFALEYLPKEVKCLRFLNPDGIARGLGNLPAGLVAGYALGPMKNGKKTRRRDNFIAPAARAFRRVARRLRAENARLGLPLIVGENGKVVEKPA